MTSLAIAGSPNPPVSVFLSFLFLFIEASLVPVLPEDIVDELLVAGGGDWGPWALNVMVQAEERERQSENLLMENNEHKTEA